MKEPSDELDFLFNALADGEAAEDRDAQEARLAELLRSDAAARRRYRQFAELHSALMWDYAGLAAGENDATRSATPVKRFQWKRLSAIAAAIVFIALAGAAWIGSYGRSVHAVAKLEAAAGSVSWSDDGGAQRAGLAAGAELSAGTLIVDGASGSAQLRFADGTVLTLTGDAEIGFSDDGQKRLVLRRGAFTAHVAKQSAGKPMIVRTSTAEIEVLGTVFALASDLSQTALNVESGSVRLKRLADGRAVDVPANHLAVASLDVRNELQTQVQKMPPQNWRRSFEAPPSQDSKGQWFPPTSSSPGRMRALPYVAGRVASEGRLVIHHGVLIRAGAGEDAGLVALSGSSMFHVRYRTQQRSGLKLFLSCENPEGTFGGNFELALDPAIAPADAEGWMTADVPMSPLHAVMPQEHPSADGKRLRTLILHSYESDVALEIAEIGISQPQ